MVDTLVIVVLVLLIAVGAVLAYAATRPDTFRIERATSIKAPPEKIFPLIHDFHRWAGWSPYEKKDPAMKKTYSGAASGKGAIYEWEGDRNVGKGRIEITGATPPSKVALDLHMMKPVAARNAIEFTLEPKGETTRVTWAMAGQVPYMAKLMHLVFDMDSMVGKDFERASPI